MMSAITIKGYLASFDPPAGGPPLHYLLRVSSGPIVPPRPPPLPLLGAVRIPSPRRGQILIYYYSPGCRSCEEFLSVEIPRWEKKLGIRIDLQRKDILDTAAFEELSAFAAAHGQKVRSIPALQAGETLLQGDRK